MGLTILYGILNIPHQIRNKRKENISTGGLEKYPFLKNNSRITIPGKKELNNLANLLKNKLSVSLYILSSIRIFGSL